MTPSSSAPVVISRVQRDPVATADGRNLQAPPPEPSAPSPGHVLYNSEDHSDLAFLVGEEEWRFPAHSFVLSKTGNATFHALLTTAKVSDVTRVKQIVLEDRQCVLQQSPLVLRLPNMQPDVFEQILRFIYTGQVSLSSVESTLRLIEPAQTFHLPELRSRCLAYISKHVSANNVLQVLKHLLAPAIHPQSTAAKITDSGASTSPCQDVECHEEDNRQNELVFKCFLIVDRHADAVLNSEAFDTLDYEMMVEIAKRDTLEVTSESIVFDAVMRWACRACKRERKELTAENKSEVLGKALFLVRYLLMTHEEFLRGPVSQGVLQKDDREVLLSRISGDSPTSSEALPEHLKGWKLSMERRRQSQLTSPNSDCLSGVTEASPSPSGSVLVAHPVSTPTVSSTDKKNGERKKKSMSKKLLNGVGDLVICVIQLLD